MTYAFVIEIGICPHGDQHNGKNIPFGVEMVHSVCVNESDDRGNNNICKAFKDGIPY